MLRYVNRYQKEHEAMAEKQLKLDFINGLINDNIRVSVAKINLTTLQDNINKAIEEKKVLRLYSNRDRRIITDNKNRDFRPTRAI
jgi:hypothetical protein